ncbi:LOW QUALITY PROTEIN: alpha-ketoglutarate-dependent dioxygenase alkB homolog 7, mitochondrial-like [Octopus sinensis]|uniref:LOW QUALITY PROTEIN: alpha-ketoglutarate-dependent dioxygenase alkB homolog 7, mitochondrial-like n=1 Tax=Octopus sinensis TaxID=2607531 RepID=A0A6P7TJI3_9MOLL|nr:LOW QUALITY PROTEIN: alpha-ketoglutarate-dependent dioxygenase alkB homolog 7, mitochondrial-like [Octopus sinensis]
MTSCLTFSIPKLMYFTPVLLGAIRNRPLPAFTSNSLCKRGTVSMNGDCSKWWERLLSASDPDTEKLLQDNVEIHEDFLSLEEHESLLAEIEPYLKRLRYEYDHWDDAIHGYRETERKQWNDSNTKILDRVKSVAFQPPEAPLPFVHVLDINKDGYIKPHVDSVRFCGRTIAGLSLLSESVMRLVCEKDKSKSGDILLLPRSLYILRDQARFDYTHEVLPDKTSMFKGKSIPRSRRISVISRLEVKQ